MTNIHCPHSDSSLPPRQEKGILLVALANPYYGKMAYNLLISIKCKWNIPVALVHDSIAVSHLNDEQLLTFDQRINCPLEYMMTGERIDPYYAKLNLDKLTPFEKTLFLDADTVWNVHKNPEDLFAELNNVDFTVANRGYNSDFSMWVNVDEIKKQFELDRYLDCSSEIIYFSDNTVFEKAREVHAVAFQHRKINMCKPDEPCFAIALELLGKAPHRTPYKPSWWYYENPKTNISAAQIKNDYYVISAGGAFFDPLTKSPMQRTYENYVGYAFNIIGETPFPLVMKSKVLPDRKSY